MVSLHHVSLLICALQSDSSANHYLLPQYRLGKTPNEEDTEKEKGRNVYTVTWLEKDVGFISYGRVLFIVVVPADKTAQRFSAKAKSVHAI